MEQYSFVDLEMAARRKTRKTHAERLTERLDKLVPWKDLCDLIRPHYFVSGRRGRQPFPLELMLRIHILQSAYNLSDPQMEDFLHENMTARRFVGLDLADRTPDETTILHFRHILEKHDLGRQIFEVVKMRLMAEGLSLVKGRIVDATFIEAPTSTKNKEKKRDPQMASGKKGNVWHFGMKMHIATDDIVGVVTNVAFGPANEHDITRASELLEDDIETVRGDAGYLGLRKREDAQGGKPNRTYEISVRPGKLKGRGKDDILCRLQHQRSSIRAKVENLFARVKLQMGYKKTRYRGIFKNANRLHTLLALGNLFTFECWVRRQREKCAQI